MKKKLTSVPHTTVL